MLVRKREIKKKNQRIITNSPWKKNTRDIKISPEYYKNLSKVKTLKKRNYANIRNENMSDSNRERRKEYMENYYYEGKHCRII